MMQCFFVFHSFHRAMQKKTRTLFVSCRISFLARFFLHKKKQIFFFWTEWQDLQCQSFTSIDNIYKEKNTNKKKVWKKSLTLNERMNGTFTKYDCLEYVYILCALRTDLSFECMLTFIHMLSVIEMIRLQIAEKHVHNDYPPYSTCTMIKQTTNENHLNVYCPLSISRSSFTNLDYTTCIQISIES